MWIVAFHPKFGRFVVYLMHFFVDWSIEKIFFDYIYSLGDVYGYK
jgi:hypothetical protein